MEQRGGKQAEGSKGGDGRYRHFQELRETLVSVFIDNIPGDKDAFWLRKLFESAGKTLDVFIPFRERRATKSRFGFVRFKEMEEAQAAIRRWNGATFGRFSLAVKLADCGGKPRFTSHVAGDVQCGRMSEVLWRPPLAKVVDVDVPKEGSNQLRAKKRKVTLEVNPENEEWMQRSAVAVLKALIPSSQLEEELKLNGVKIHKIFPFGGMKVLIHFFSLEDLELCLSGSFSSISRRFSSIHIWNEEVPSRLRSVWLSIIGLPFKAWSEENFQKVIAPIGFYLKTELKDFQESGLERARVLVETKRLDRIFEVFDAVVGGKVVETVISEECYFNGRETDWKTEESADGGEEDVLVCSEFEGQMCKDRLQLEMTQDGSRDRGSAKGRDRDRGTDGDLCRSDSGAVKSDHLGVTNLGSSESVQGVPESAGKEETCASSLRWSVDKEKVNGQALSNRGASECNWDTTLFDFLQHKGRGSAGKETKEMSGLGVRLPPGGEGEGRDDALVQRDAPDLQRQVEVDEVDSISLSEAHPRHFVCFGGASKRVGKQKMSLRREIGAKDQNSFKLVKRKESKEKEVFKFQRRKKRALLDRLKKSYIEELEITNKFKQLTEADRLVDHQRVGQKKKKSGSEEEDLEISKKRVEDLELSKKREEAILTYQLARSLGLEGLAPDEEIIQQLMNLD